MEAKNGDSHGPGSPPCLIGLGDQRQDRGRLLLGVHLLQDPAGALPRNLRGRGVWGGNLPAGLQPVARLHPLLPFPGPGG